MLRGSRFLHLTLDPRHWHKEARRGAWADHLQGRLAREGPAIIKVHRVLWILSSRKEAVIEKARRTPRIRGTWMPFVRGRGCALCVPDGLRLKRAWIMWHSKTFSLHINCALANYEPVTMKTLHR
jgi:hypothetical protein